MKMAALVLRSLLVLAALAVGVAARADEPLFVAAQPVWPAGRETEMNLSVGFRAEFTAVAGQKVSLRVAAASIYRASVNGAFLACGPARGPHGWYRVDQWDISQQVRPGVNLVAIEVAGYNVNSYDVLDQPSFLAAEVRSGPQVLASTAGEGAPFSATLLDYRVQKVQRYSFQRPFTEVYRLRPGWDLWSQAINYQLPATNSALAVQPGKQFLPRRAVSRLRAA